MMIQFDLIIVGGSASGLCAAIQAARCKKAASIAVLEQMPRIGKKILATGNGRCNLSNVNAGGHAYRNADFAASALKKYDTQATLSFFKSLGLLTVADSEGRIYPMSNTAASVLDALRFEAERLHIQFFCGTAVKEIAVLKNGFSLRCLQTPDNPEKAKNQANIIAEFRAKYLVLAAGGKASPVHGSDGSGFELLRQLGHSITPRFPSLVQLTTDTSLTKQLKGIRSAASIKVEIEGKIKSVAQGEILFTEYGLSGIAAMEASRAVSEYFASGCKGGCCALLDLAPSLNKEDLKLFIKNFALDNPLLPPERLLFGIMPARIGQVVCKACGLYNITGGLSEPQLNRLAEIIKEFRLQITGTKGFNQAQVTAGGADVNEFHPEFLASRKVKNLYACGEILDVDGGCGGFNLQWAWSSGLLAGELNRA